MVALLVEHAEPAAGTAVHYCEVVEKVQRAVVEPDVIVRAQAQYVPRNVGTVMRPAKRTDVRSFSVGARWNPQLLSTHLASIAVQAFDGLDHDAVANLALYHRRDARNWPSRPSRRRNVRRQAGHTTGTREQWLAARQELLEAEKAHTRLGDE